jgi:hypothetical protein
MTSFYLTRPKIPLAAALSQMLENIELELAQGKLPGDYEDEPDMRIFGLRELWPDLASHSPDAALAMIKQKKGEEAEKAKEKIEILGASLSGGLTIMLVTVTELCLMIYLLAYLIHVRAILQGHQAAISESPFFGIMRPGLGRLVIVATLFVIPLSACTFALFSVFPAFNAEWLSLRWYAAIVFQCTLIVAVGTTGFLLIRQAYDAAATLGRAAGSTARWPRYVRGHQRGSSLHRGLTAYHIAAEWLGSQFRWAGPRR